MLISTFKEQYNIYYMYMSGINFSALMNKATMKITGDWLARKHSQHLMTL